MASNCVITEGCGWYFFFISNLRDDLQRRMLQLPELHLLPVLAWLEEAWLQLIYQQALASHLIRLSIWGGKEMNYIETVHINNCGRVKRRHFGPGSALHCLVISHSAGAQINANLHWKGSRREWSSIYYSFRLFATGTTDLSSSLLPLPSFFFPLSHSPLNACNKRLSSLLLQ